MSEEFLIVTMLIVLVLWFIIYVVYISRPKTTKAKVVEKHDFVAGLTENSVTFLLPDKTTCTLDMTKKMYDALSVGDIVNVKYQGYKALAVVKIKQPRPAPPKPAPAKKQ